MDEPKTRDYQFDSIKGLMIFLVVLCHFLSQFQAGGVESTTATKYLYNGTYSFHMAVFVFISGYFSKRNTDYKTYIKKAVANCFIPYVLFNFIYALAFDSIRVAFIILSPQFSLWFLLSLFMWKIIIEAITRFKRPVALLIVFLFPLYIGLYANVGHFLSISRTICFFPFFFVGYLLPSETISKIRGMRKIVPIALFLLSIAAIGIITHYKICNISAEALYMDSSYENCNQSIIQGVVLRSIIIIVGFVSIYFFLAVIPAKQNVLSTFGRYSLTVYLFHSGVIRLMERFRVFTIESPLLSISCGIVFSLLLCFLFGNKIVSNAFSSIMNRINKILLD